MAVHYQVQYGTVMSWSSSGSGVVYEGQIYSKWYSLPIN